MVPICLEQWCTEANEATQTHCYNPVTPAYPVRAYYSHGQQCRCQEDRVSFPTGRLEKTTRSSPRGSAPSNRIWNNTTLHSPKQQIWLRTALCGGRCWRMALRNLRGACQKRRRWVAALSAALLLIVSWTKMTFFIQSCSKNPAQRGSDLNYNDDWIVQHIVVVFVKQMSFCVLLQGCWRCMCHGILHL